MSIFSLQQFSQPRHQFDSASNLRQAFNQAAKAMMVAITGRTIEQAGKSEKHGKALRAHKLRRRFDLMSKPRRVAPRGNASAIIAVPRNFLLKPCQNG